MQCPSTLSTQDLETEIFLHMTLQMSADAADKPSKELADAVANAYAVGSNSDGMAPPRCGHRQPATCSDHHVHVIRTAVCSIQQ